MVLILITCVGLIAGAAITYAGTSLSSTVVYSTRRSEHADAEAAIRTAMQYIKADAVNGGSLAADTGGTCATTFSYPGSTGTVTVAVCPQAGSLSTAGQILSPLLTLAPLSSGKGIDQSKNSTWNVRGNVWSNSYIHVTTVNVTGRVTAWNDCGSSTIVATSGQDCAAHTTYNEVVPPAGMDPGDPSLGNAADWVPAAAPGAVQTPSSCNLVPGVYTSGTALTTRSNACSGSGSPLNLAAGVYYLNFPSGSASTWTINGTLQGATCASESDPGVQIVLANNSQISNLGSINIPCGGRPTTSAPRIGIIGLKTAIGGVPAQAGCVLLGGCAVIRSGSNNGADSFVVADTVYLPQNTFSKICKNGCNFNIGQALIAWSATLDANPALVGSIIVGGGLAPPGPGKVVFQASIGGAPRIDAYATLDPGTYAPTITNWVVR